MNLSNRNQHLMVLNGLNECHDKLRELSIHAWEDKALQDQINEAAGKVEACAEAAWPVQDDKRDEIRELERLLDRCAAIPLGEPLPEELYDKLADRNIPF